MHHVNLAHAYMKAGNKGLVGKPFHGWYDDAEAALHRALELRPSDAMALAAMEMLIKNRGIKDALV